VILKWKKKENENNRMREIDSTHMKSILFILGFFKDN
jgi:hypothetical protein